MRCNQYSKFISVRTRVIFSSQGKNRNAKVNIEIRNRLQYSLDLLHVEYLYNVNNSRFKQRVLKMIPLKCLRIQSVNLITFSILPFLYSYRNNAHGEFQNQTKHICF